MTEPETPRASIVQFLRVALVGFFMGVADLIPGVSGGTIAFICGIYGRLINGIKSFDIEAIRLVFRFDLESLRRKIPFFFFIPLGLGLITAVFTLSKLLSHLFQTHPVELWAFFFGLILGSIVLLSRETWPWKVREWTTFLVATILAFLVVGLPVMKTPDTLAFLYLSGAIAICAMILPGISGSYVLVILGKYGQVLDAINSRDFLSLAVFGAGIVTGILSFVRVVSWLLQRYRRVTLIALTGVMTGALRTVWPWKETLSTRMNSKGDLVPLHQTNILPALDSSFVWALVLAMVGAVVVVGMSRLRGMPNES
jgi:putative membrane protein